jgi:hypothetical protein
LVAFGVAPLLSGVILGLSLIAKELEQGTAEFAWSVVPSRRAWLGARVVPVVLGLLAVGLIAGALGDILEGQRQPTLNPQGSLESLGFRGIAIAGLGLSALGISLLASSIIGRVLPAFLVAGFLVATATVAIAAANDALLQRESVIVVADEGREPVRAVEYLIKTPEGEILSYTEAYVRYGTAAVDDIDPSSGLVQMVRIIPGRLYPLTSWRLAILHGALGGVTIALSFIAVERKRP